MGDYDPQRQFFGGPHYVVFGHGRLCKTFAPDLFAFAAVLPDYGSEIQPISIRYLFEAINNAAHTQVVRVSPHYFVPEFRSDDRHGLTRFALASFRVCTHYRGLGVSVILILQSHPEIGGDSKRCFEFSGSLKSDVLSF